MGGSGREREREKAGGKESGREREAEDSIDFFYVCVSLLKFHSDVGSWPGIEGEREREGEGEKKKA